MSNFKKQQIEKALKETRAYIAKESARADDLRPAEIQELLEKYKAHEIKLIGMLNNV
jgi:F0F1-type ATP synthase membrane subunit b/b'